MKQIIWYKCVVGSQREARRGASLAYHRRRKSRGTHCCGKPRFVATIPPIKQFNNLAVARRISVDSCSSSPKKLNSEQNKCTQQENLLCGLGCGCGWQLPPPNHEVEVVVVGGGGRGGGSVASFRALQTKTRDPNMSDSFSFFLSCFLVCLRVIHHHQQQ